MTRLERLGISIHRAGHPGDVIQTVPKSWVVRSVGLLGSSHYDYLATKREAEIYARYLADSIERRHSLV